MRSITTLFLWMLGFSLMAQSSFQQSFENSASDNWTYTANPTPYEVGGDVWDTVTALGPITPYDMNYFWGMQDLNNGNGGGNFWHYLTFDPIDVSTMGDMELSFWYYSDGFDEAFGDSLAYQVSLDGAAWTTHGTLLNPNTDAWTEVKVNVPAATNTVAFRVEAIQNGGSDYAGIDKVMLSPMSDSVMVTFAVDVSYETVNAGVTIAGSFQGWNSVATPMTNAFGAVYEYTAKFKKGDTIQYKYVIDGANWESVPNECAVGGNRQLIIPSADTALPLVCFSSCTQCAALFNLTLQVDMTGQTISPNGVHVAGSFQGWDPAGSPMMHIGNNIYSFTTQVQEGSTHQYKFINGNDWSSAESVPAECGVDDGFGGYNRQVTMGHRDTTLPAVKFGGCETAQSGMTFLDYSMLKTVDANFEPVHKDTTGWIKGVVYSIDFDGNAGYSFFTRDGQEGINIFNFSDVNGYVVMQGDSLHIHGKLDFYRGLIEFVPDSIVVVDQNKSYGDPDVVNNLDESTEGNYIRINGVYLADPTQWPTSPGSRNVDIVTPMNDTLTMRIDSDTDIDGAMAAPTGNFDVIGCGSQFDPSSPYDEGYQILPRSQMDIIEGPEFMDYTMLKKVDANFEPIHKDTTGWIKGVVYSIDFDGNAGYSFFTRDGQEGINIFNFSDVNGYVVTQGDMLHMHGKLDFYRGLIEFVPDSIVVVSQNNNYGDPDVVSNLDESTEGNYIRINDVYLADPTQWPTSTGSRNVDIVTPMGDTLTMRIDSDTDIDGAMAAPTGNFDVIGCGSQFDPSSPYDEGYQILPRYQLDIIQGPSDTPSVFFTLTNITVNEDAGTADLIISISDPNVNSTSVDVVVTGGTATMGVDYTFTSPTTVTFPANSSDPITVQVPIIDDFDQESDETIIFELQNPTNDAKILINTATVTIMDNDKPVPVYSVDQINGVDSDGVGDSIGVRCELRGVVTTIDYRGGGLQFWIQDPTSGINVFSFNEVSNYVVTEGDSIHVIGVIDQFNGLLEIIPDSIGLISQGNDLPEAIEIDTLMEEYESEVLVMNDVEMLDSIPTGGGYNIQALFNGDTVTIRVDDRTDLDTMPFPTGFYRVTGVGSQFDPTIPYFDGYQLMIRRFADFEPMLAPVAGFDYSTDSLVVQFTDESQNYPSAWEWTFGDGSSSNEQNPIHTYAADGTYEVCLTASNSQGSSTACDSVTVSSVGITNVAAQIQFSIYPVPAGEYITITSAVNMDFIQVLDISGKIVFSTSNSTRRSNLDISKLSSGIYLVKVYTDKGIAVQRFVKE